MWQWIWLLLSMELLCRLKMCLLKITTLHQKKIILWFNRTNNLLISSKTRLSILITKYLTIPTTTLLKTRIQISFRLIGINLLKEWCRAIFKSERLRINRSMLVSDFIILKGSRNRKGLRNIMVVATWVSLPVPGFLV